MGTTMRLTPLVHAIASAKTESELRSQLLDKAGYCTGSQAWGLDLLDYQQKILASDLQGLPVSSCDRYQAIGRDQDITSKQMLRQHTPVQLCSLLLKSTHPMQWTICSGPTISNMAWSLQF